MSSPSKKIRLTPSTSRLTQESKITSTPNKWSSAYSGSPSVSAISSCSRKTRNQTDESPESDENDRTSVSSRRSLFTIASEASISSEALIEDYDAYFDSFRIKYTGIIWELHKPVSKGTIYANILSNPSDAQNIVTELFMLYTQKPQKAILNLLKFCLDVAGFQNFDHTIYSFKDNAAKEIIDSLEVNIKDEKLESTARYLLMETKTNLAKTLKMAIYNFIHKLILTAHAKGILYHEVFSKNVFTFVKCMSFSNVMAVRHTGVVFGMKILTALVLTQNEIYQELKTCRQDPNNLDDSDIDEKQGQMEGLNSLLEYFYFIFIKNYHIQENVMIAMRIDCIKELQIWIQLNPKLFIDSLQAVNYLLKKVIDTSKDVRLAALRASERLLNASGMVKFLERVKDKFCDTIGKRFYDIDQRVAVKAIDIFNIMLKWEDLFISALRVRQITNLIFDNIFTIGEAACRFLLTLFQGYTPEDVIQSLAKITLKNEHCLTQLLVEGFLCNCRAIQDWALYCKILHAGPRDQLEQKQAIAAIFAEAVSQTLTGKSSEMRVLSRTVVDIESIEHRKVAECFPALNKLLQIYGEYPKILIELLKILDLVNTNILTGNFCQEYSKLAKTCQILFDGHEDEDLLKKIAEVLFHFSEIVDFADRARAITDELGSKHTEELNFYSKQASADVSLAPKKVAILYRHMNLNKKFTWEILTESWPEANKKIAADLITCCAWYIIWSLRSLTDLSMNRKQKELPGQLELHKRTCNDFTHTCFNILKHFDGSPLHLKIYKCMCDFYKTYSDDLTPSIKINKKFEEVSLRIYDASLQDIFTNFLNKYILFNERIPLDERRECVEGFVNLAHADVLPTTVLAHVFKLYHLNFEEYGPLIEASLKCIAKDPDENGILLMVIHTLATSLEDILRKHNVVDINTEESKNLQLLVKKFLQFEYFRQPKRCMKKLLYFSIKYAFKQKEKYAFLYYAKYFIDLLFDVADMKEVSEFFKKNLPKKAEKNDAVLFFGNYLKSFTAAAVAKTKSISSTSGTSKNKENQDLPKSKSASSAKRSRPKKPETPSKKMTAAMSTPKTSAKSFSFNATESGKGKNKKKTTSETNIGNSEDDITIEDSESDGGIDRTLRKMRI